MKKTLSNQRGAVLIVGLMILVVLSILGITTMQTSTLEEKMANNMGQRQIAFQAAEAALRQAESRLVGDMGGIDGTLVPNIKTPKTIGTDPWWDIVNTWTTSGINGSEIMSTGSDGLEIDGVAEQPRYIVELLQEIETGEESLEADAVVDIDTMYRVTARGVGGTGNIEVMLQVTHLR